MWSTTFDAGNPHVRFDEGETPHGHWPPASHPVRVSLLYMTSLAWNLKAWFGLLLPNGQRGLDLIKMEFRRFLHAIVLLPAQIVRTSRRVSISGRVNASHVIVVAGSISLQTFGGDTRLPFSNPDSEHLGGCAAARISHLHRKAG